MSYASGYQGFPNPYATEQHTAGTPTEHQALKAADSSAESLAPQRPARNRPAARYVPQSRKKLWVPALTIIGALVAGVAFALGHHAYYSSLNGKPIATTTVLDGLKVYDQKWSNIVGTSFAFLVKFFFAISIGQAYVETLWKTARRPLGLSVAGLDASFGLLTNPMKFLSVDLLFSAQFLLLLAAISWLVPIVSVFTPGALTVGSTFVNASTTCSVPALNLASKYAANNLGSYSIIHDTEKGSFLSPSQALRRVATTTLLGGTYTAPASPCAASASLCSYATSYIAPYLECNQPVAGNYTGDDNFLQSGGTTLWNVTYYPGTSAGDQLVVGWLTGESGEFTVNVVTCAAMNATYSVVVQHASAGAASVQLADVVIEGVLNTDPSLLGFQVDPLSDPTNSDVTRSEILSAAVMVALEDMISGSIVASDSSSPELTLNINNNTMVGMSNFGVANETERTFTPSPDIPGLLTSLLSNFTIGLMAANVSDTATHTPCVEAATLAIYVYHPRTLWAPYAAAAFAALLAALVGFRAIWANKSTVDTNFTTMIEVTRNAALDEVPGEDPGRVRLRYGLINDRGAERMAFGQLWNFGEHPLASKGEA
ncbi:hypothetical protein B0H11DRAFT_1984326 [Mycena galericulata]|nr:hypothetical protein B0H11DRAFT_1984326 [Mycena galericulata]